MLTLAGLFKQLLVPFSQYQQPTVPAQIPCSCTVYTPPRHSVYIQMLCGLRLTSICMYVCTSSISLHTSSPSIFPSLHPFFPFSLSLFLPASFPKSIIPKHSLTLICLPFPFCRSPKCVCCSSRAIHLSQEAQAQKAQAPSSPPSQEAQLSFPRRRRTTATRF